MQRAETTVPLSRMQEVVCNLLGIGLSYREVAESLLISVEMTKEHTKRAAAKIPGDLPAQARCIAWARGASLDVLQGLTLRYEVMTRHPQGREVVGLGQLA